MLSNQGTCLVQNLELERKLNILFAVVDDVNVSAGGYLHFTKGLLLSYYGILATYITILLQTV